MYFLFQQKYSLNASNQILAQGIISVSAIVFQGRSTDS